MLRRFSINFTLLSMLFDGLVVSLSLWITSELRPWLNSFPFIEPILTPPTIPRPLFIIFPFIWIVIISIFSLYDGRKFLRVVDEYSTLSLALLISSVSAAGVLYLSFRDISRAQFLLFVLLVYLTCFGWRILARSYFRLQAAVPASIRHVLVVGCGTLGEKVRAQLQDPQIIDVHFVGFIDDLPVDQVNPNLLGGTNQIRDVTLRESISDVIIALPHSAYHMMIAMV